MAIRLTSDLDLLYFLHMPKALKNLPSYKLAVLALVASNVIWGAAPPIFKFALTNIPPFSLAFLRFGIATLLLLPFLYKSKYWKVEKKDWFVLVQNAFYGISLNISFFFLGLKLAPSINASIIASASSIFTTLLAVIFIKEKLSPKIVLGNLIGFAGVMIIVISPLTNQTNQAVRFNLGEMAGNIFFVLATLAAAGQAITTRKLARKYRSRTFTFYGFLLGAISFLPIVFAEINQDPLWPLRLDTRGLSGIIFGAILSSFVAYSLWGFAAERITATEIGLYMYLNPIVTVLIAVPLLGENITILFLLGAALAVVGIYIAERRIPYWPLHQKSKSKG